MGSRGTVTEGAMELVKHLEGVRTQPVYFTGYHNLPFSGFQKQKVRTSRVLSIELVI
jgi:hypothetical protein